MQGDVDNTNCTLRTKGEMERVDIYTEIDGFYQTQNFVVYVSLLQVIFECVCLNLLLKFLWGCM